MKECTFTPHINDRILGKIDKEVIL
jgi:hypothetical protein